MLRTGTCAYQGIRNVSFTEHFANELTEWFTCWVFLVAFGSTLLAEIKTNFLWCSAKSKILVDVFSLLAFWNYILSCCSSRKVYVFVMRYSHAIFLKRLFEYSSLVLRWLKYGIKHFLMTHHYNDPYSKREWVKQNFPSLKSSHCYDQYHSCYRYNRHYQTHLLRYLNEFSKEYLLWIFWKMSSTQI